MIYPDLNQAKTLAAGFKAIPVAFEVLADTLTPINLFLKIKDSYKNCFLLESVNSAEHWGRYSFIGFNPKAEIMIKDGKVLITDENGARQSETKDPVKLLSIILEDYKSPKIKDMPKLTGGLAGYFSYDTVRYIEKKLSCPPKDDLNTPDCHFMLCDEIIAFDHLKQKTIIIVNVKTGGDFEKNYENGVKKAKEINETLINLKPETVREKHYEKPEIKSNMQKEDFISNVKAAKEYIRNGDIIQVVLSQRFEVKNPPDPFNVYRMLRVSNPSPYMYFFKFGDYFISGASPEMLVSVDDDIAATRPIAGTARRGKTEKEDKELEQSLLHDEKERAEHTMLVDLGRNDISRVSKFGTVKVTDYMRVEKYSQVMHLVSDVEGRLEEGKTSLDALMAVLPAGTLSGAPKVRAMEIIDELEKEKRGLYGGTAGYIGFNGDMDTCIAIRTVLFKNNKAYIQAGAGIVSDSVPEKEFEETENKAKAMIKAITEAGEMK